MATQWTKPDQLAKSRLQICWYWNKAQDKVQRNEIEKRDCKVSGHLDRWGIWVQIVGSKTIEFFEKWDSQCIDIDPGWVNGDPIKPVEPHRDRKFSGWQDSRQYWPANQDWALQQENGKPGSEWTKKQRKEWNHEKDYSFNRRDPGQ